MTTIDFELDLDELFPPTAVAVDDVLRDLGFTRDQPPELPTAAVPPIDVSPIPALTIGIADKWTTGQGAPATVAPVAYPNEPGVESATADSHIDEFGVDLSDEDCRSATVSPGRLLEDALSEYELAPRPGTYLRSVGLGGARFLIVGTWRGIHKGQGATIFGCAGREGSFVRSEYLIGDTTNDARTHRVWMIKHMVGLPLRVWFNTGGADRSTRYMVLDASDIGVRDVDKLEYEQARRAWSL